MSYIAQAPTTQPPTVYIPPIAPKKARLSGEAQSLFWLSIVMNIGAIAITLYAAWKEGWLSTT